MNNKNNKKLTLFLNMDLSNLNFLKLKSAVLSFLSFILLTFSFSSQAASLTSYRLYLDDNNRTESFVIFTKGNSAEKCSLKLKHFNFDNEGNMTLHKEKKVPDNSAAPWVRFSPKNFTVQPGTPQTIRFTMRRKPNAEEKEYRSYLAISCKDVKNTPLKKETESGKPSITVQPNLVQNVPIVVRTAPLQATAQFEDIKIKDNMVTANLKRDGERSIYGRLSLINNKTGKELAYLSGLSVYPETTTHQFKFSIKGDNMPAIEDMALKFVENENYGGSLTIETNLK